MDSSSSYSTSYSLSKPNLDLAKWVDSMRKTIAEDHDKTTNTDVCIFAVPKVLLHTDPDSYIPQQVALGPFHQWRPEVYDMQKYKLDSAKKAQKERNVKFERIVEVMKHNDECRIRACYQKFLDMDGDALAWMMAIDMAFLLDFLQLYYMREQSQTFEIVSQGRSSNKVDVSVQKLSHMTILRDLVKVENQIPLFLIQTMLEHQSPDKSAEETLQIMLMGLYRELSPFQYRHQSPNFDINNCSHLLDFLYHMTVPSYKELGIDDIAEATIHVGVTEEKDEGAGEEESFAKPSHLKQFQNYMWNIIMKTNLGFATFVKKIIFSKPIALVTKLPWKIISSLPLLKFLKGPVEHMLVNFQGKEKEKSEEGSTKSNPPLIEEITIPSVTEMAKAGISFSPVNGPISEISFNEKTSTLYLPVVHLDVNTEVYLRNLVAYEACVASGPLIMARYTELMNGIIDTEEDAKHLMERKIVWNHLKSDKEAADLWNGMSKSVKMTKVPKMDRVIEEVNRSYNKTLRVKLANFMRTYVFGSWRFLTLLAAIFLLFLSTVQTFCSVYTCHRLFQQLPELDQPQG